MAFFRGPNVVRDGLILYLDAANKKSFVNGSNTWRDLSGNNNHFTLYNIPTFNSSGYFTFNGTTQYARSTNTLNLSATNKVTILMWFKPASYPASGTVKLLYELTNNFNSYTTGFVHSYNDNSLSQNYEIFAALKGDVGYNIGVWSKTYFNDLLWKNSTCVFDTSQSSTENLFYVNGSFATAIQNPSPGYASNNTNNFANDYLYLVSRAGSNYFADINLASVQIYNRVLSASEILQNYNATKTRFGL